MIGSPENNFNTMQNQQPSPQKYGNALQQFRSVNNFSPMSAALNPTKFMPGQNRQNDMQYGNPIDHAAPPNFGSGSGMPPGGTPPNGVLQDYNPPNFNPNGRMNPPALGVPTGQNPMDFSGPGQPISPNAPYNLQPPLPAPQTSTYNTGLVSPQSGVQSSILNGSSAPAKTNFAQNAMTAMKKNPF